MAIPRQSENRAPCAKPFFSRPLTAAESVGYDSWITWPRPSASPGRPPDRFIMSPSPMSSGHAAWVL